MKKVIYLLLVILVISCEKNEAIEETELTGIKEEVFSFTDDDSFFKTNSFLSKLTDQELLDWSNANNKNSLLIYEGKSAVKRKSNVQQSLKAILNKDLMFKIGEDKIWLLNDVLYLIPSNLTEEETDELKNSPNELERIGEVGSSIIEGSTVFEGNNNKALYNTSLYRNETHRKNYQKEFVRKRYVDRCGSGVTHSGSPTMKYFHELQSQWINVRGNNQYALFLITNIDWYDGGWKQAGEERNITINITDWSYLKSVYIPSDQAFLRPSVNINKTYSCVRGRTRTLIREDVGLISYLDWAIKLNGTITHEINTDIGNKWTNSVSW